MRRPVEAAGLRSMRRLERPFFFVDPSGVSLRTGAFGANSGVGGAPGIIADAFGLGIDRHIFVLPIQLTLEVSDHFLLTGVCPHVLHPGSACGGSVGEDAHEMLDHNRVKRRAIVGISHLKSLC
jgi:hypothetical protein